MDTDKKGEVKLPKFLTGDVYIKHELIVCDNCGGVGYTTSEECYDYHKGDYRDIRSACYRCKGEGRMIKRTEGFHIHQPDETVTTMPYSEFKDFVDPFKYDSKWFRMRLDRNHDGMNRKYPELDAISYEKYDDLLQQYLLFDELKK